MKVCINLIICNMSSESSTIWFIFYIMMNDFYSAVYCIFSLRAVGLFNVISVQCSKATLVDRGQ